MSDEINSYSYVGMPLTPAVIEELAVELFDGTTVRRARIITAVEMKHLERGGIRSKANLTSSVKKALTNLKVKGQAGSAMKGYWQIGKQPDFILPQACVEEEVAPNTQDGNDIETDYEIGEGSESVYVYYLPVFKDQALQKGETSWACKIGRTDHDPLTRILAQASTALPEHPHVSVIFHTDNSRNWEVALHSILRVRGLHLNNSPGTEWFKTSPEEIVELISLIEGPLTKCKGIKH